MRTLQYNNTRRNANLWDKFRNSNLLLKTIAELLWMWFRISSHRIRVLYTALEYIALGESRIAVIDTVLTCGSWQVSGTSSCPQNPGWARPVDLCSRCRQHSTATSLPHQLTLWSSVCTIMPQPRHVKGAYIHKLDAIEGCRAPPAKFIITYSDIHCNQNLLVIHINISISPASMSFLSSKYFSNLIL